MNEQEYRQRIVEVGRRLYARGYIVASDGNVSVRTDARILATPTGVCKGFLTPEMLAVVDGDGKKIEGQLNPSSELAMHLEIYRLRPDVNAVVHAHPPCGTGFAAAGMALDTPLISEVVLTLGCIPLAAYGTPTTQELATAISPYVPHYDALLLANHGALTYGPDLDTAYFRMETLEHFARISLVARLLGREKPLAPEAVEKLFQIREQLGLGSPTATLCGIRPAEPLTPARSPAAEHNGGDELITLTRKQLVELIAESAEIVARLLSGRR